MLLHLIAAAWGQASTDDLSATAPSPVYELARRDLKANRIARVGAIIAIAAPGVVGVGGVALVAPERSAYYVGAALSGAGAIGFVVGPSMLFYGSSRSAVALRHQGLVVRTRWLWAAVPTWVLSGSLLYTTAALDATSGPQAYSFDLPELGVAATYTAAICFGAMQVRTNHLARREAGWLGLVPFADRGIEGVALAGRW